VREVLNLGRIPLEVDELWMEIRMGFDGAGHQLEIAGDALKGLHEVGHKTASLIHTAYFPMSIQNYKTKEVYWQCKDCNSRDFLKTLAISVEDENVDVMKDLLKKWYPKDLEQFQITVDDGKTLTVHLTIHNSMYDHKCRKIMCGAGGKYCVYCPATKEDYHKISYHRESKRMTYTKASDYIAEYRRAINPRRGTLYTSSAKRRGMTAEPVVAPELLGVLHTPMNVMKWIIQIMTKMACEFTEEWNVCGKERKERYTKSMGLLKKKLTQIRSFHINLVKPGLNTGSTLTGRDCKSLLQHASEFATLIPWCYRSRLVAIINNFGIIVRTINSTGGVDIELYKDLCRDTAVKIIQLGRLSPASDKGWIVMNESIHLLLDHSWEMIEANGCCGLGRLSEEVLEAMQPIMRWLRKSRCWQGDFLKNLIQLYNHGQLNGNIELRHIYREELGIREKKKRKVVTAESISSRYIDMCLKKLLKPL